MKARKILGEVWWAITTVIVTPVFAIEIICATIGLLGDFLFLFMRPVNNKRKDIYHKIRGENDRA